MNPTTPTGEPAPGGGSQEVCLLDNTSRSCFPPRHRRKNHMQTESVSEAQPRQGQIRTFEDLDAAQEASRLHTSGHRVEHCSLDASPNHRVEVMQRDDGTVSFSGFRPCASPHCPHCGVILAWNNTGKARKVLRAAFDCDHMATLLTVTIGHGIEDALRDVFDDLSASWRSCNGGRGAKAFKDALGNPVGYIRAFEVTYGKNGWHPHFHFLIVHRKPVNADAVFERYARAARKRGRHVSRDALHVQPINTQSGDIGRVSSYLSGRKGWDAASELSAGAVKDSNEGRTLGDLLRAFRLDGDGEAAELYAEYLDAMKGVSVWKTSPGLLKKLGLEDFKTDEEVLEEREKVGVPIMTLTRSQALALSLTRSRGAFLATVQHHGIKKARAFLDEAVRIAFGRRRRPPAA